MAMRRHGWQRPLHPLQIVGMSVFSLLVAAFYCFLGLFLGNKSAEIAVTTVFSFAALSAAVLFIRCTSTDPSDKTRYKLLKKKINKTRGSSTVQYGFFMLRQIVGRVIRRIERKILKSCIRRKYHLLLDPSLDSLPVMPFPLVLKDDGSAPVAPHPKDCDLSFCSLCDFEVHKHSKHCRTCNRCVEGFDHHCRWLNNCVGRKNYTTFILLMVFVLIMLIVEGGAAVAIFIRCFVDQTGIIEEMKTRHYTNFPRGVFAAISVLLVLINAYSSAALGQLFFFHVLLIRKGMRTYDYILAMKEENQLTELEEALEDSEFSSDESCVDINSPEKPTFISRGGIDQNPQNVSIRIEGETRSPTLNRPQGLQPASINPWKLITMNQERALLAATKAKERLMMQKKTFLKPLPLETTTKNGQPIMKSADNGRRSGTVTSSTEPLVMLPASPAKFSSPRRRVPSCSSESPDQKFRSNFDLQVSKELETYISKQILCSILRKDGNETSP